MTGHEVAYYEYREMLNSKSRRNMGLFATQTERKAIRQHLSNLTVQGTSDESDSVSKLLDHPLALWQFENNVHRMMAKDQSLQEKLMASSAPDAMAANPEGTLQDLLTWLLANGPAIMALVMTILKLFGIG